MRDRRIHQLTGAVALAAVLVACSDVGARGMAPAPPTGSGWHLAFSDEFDGDTIDRDRWTTCYWWGEDGCTNGSTGELQWYLPDAVSVRGGVLRLEARRQAVRASDDVTYQFTSGLVSTGPDRSDTDQPGGFEFRYGYAEMRARVPAGQGLWSAFWLLPASLESRPEVDVVEVLGHEPHRAHAHTHYGDDDDARSEGQSWVGPDLSSGWHTFAVDWVPGMLTWYADGASTWRVSDPASIPAEPMYLVANLAVGGDWPGAPDDTTALPSALEIDYIRVWQRSDTRGS